ncbi:hypothetical protein EV368DRAFT_62988 [Lentinula lateritia]|nr:hypothetical protein EV368DRAFT_62988 [Lentinula lateritia]
MVFRHCTKSLSKKLPRNRVKRFTELTQVDYEARPGGDTRQNPKDINRFIECLSRSYSIVNALGFHALEGRDASLLISFYCPTHILVNMTRSKLNEKPVPTTARLHIGDQVLIYDVAFRDGDYKVQCDLCSKWIPVGKGVNTYNLGIHRTSAPCLRLKTVSDTSEQSMPSALPVPSPHAQFPSISSRLQTPAQTASAPESLLLSPTTDR